jgi:hypothetical protein
LDDTYLPRLVVLLAPLELSYLIAAVSGVGQFLAQFY